MKDDFSLLTFALDQIWYAIHVHEVQEVVSLPELTPLADFSPFVSGIFNLRGKIVRAIDLRQRLGLRRRPWDLKTAVLIIRFQEKAYGLIVDEALSLISLPSQAVEFLSDFAPGLGSLQSKFVLAIGKHDGHLIPVLNLNRIFTTVEPQEPSDWQVKEGHG
jgi:purine-binding chemotaxis protein CheW